MHGTVSLFAILGLIAMAGGEQCSSPKVKTTSYTSSDASTLTHIPFIAEFDLTCSESTLPTLYARVPLLNKDLFVPAVRSAKVPGRYQVSWTVETNKAKVGDYEIHLYDEEGYATAKRAHERGEEVKPLVNVIVSYYGAFKGYYINSELVATILSAIIFYIAYTSKASLLA